MIIIIINNNIIIIVVIIINNNNNNKAIVGIRTLEKSGDRMRHLSRFWDSAFRYLNVRWNTLSSVHTSPFGIGTKKDPSGLLMHLLTSHENSFLEHKPSSEM